MGSVSRLSRVSPNTSSSIDNYRIYVPFCPKNSDNDGTLSPFIVCYTPSTNSWRRATSILRYHENMVLKDFAMVSVGPHVFVLGGRLCFPTQGNSPVFEDGDRSDLATPTVVAYVSRYNVVTDSWDHCAPMIVPRYKFACTVCNDKIYVAGGQSTLGSANGLSSVEVYDPALDQWRSLPDMSTRRYNCVAVNWQNRIMVVGGFVDGVGPFVMRRSSAEIYDWGENRWRFVPRMWDLDVPPNQIVVVNGRLFSSGDCLMRWKGHIESYDERQNMWNDVQGSHFNCMSPSNNGGDGGSPQEERQYLTMAPVGNHLYFLAGYRVGGGGEAAPWRERVEVHVFDTAANGEGWRSLTPVEEEEEKELCGHCCVVKQEQRRS